MLWRRFVAFALLACAFMLVFGTVSNAAAPAEWSEDQIVVKLKPSVASVFGDLINRSAGVASKVEPLDVKPHGFQVVKLRKGVSVEQAIAAYSVQPGVSYAQPDYLYHIDATPNDPMFDQLWGLNNTAEGGTARADIGAVAAWDTETGDRSVGGPIVAVLDSGVDYTHPDLAANMWTNPGEIPGDGIDNDGNGYVDDVYGYDFRNHDGDPMDDNGHGTHCAGTIGAVGNNGVGVVGVNWAVRIMALKFFPVSGGGLTSDAILAIDYANDMGADVISNSWSGGDYDAALKAVIDASEAVIVFAAGNHSTDIDAAPHYPGSYDSGQIVTVAATDRSDQLTDFSNTGAISVDVAAPGVDILSTVPTALIPSGYAAWSGTSMATPHVAGLAALILAKNPALDYAAVKQLILQTAEPRASLSGKCATGARIDAAAALAGAASPPAPGRITGSAVDTDTGLPLGRVSVRVHPASSAGLWRSYETTIDGTYQASDLPAGEYKVGFAPGGTTQQYWQNSATWAGATTVTVAAGGTVAGVNAGLTVSHITGTVTAETSGTPVQGIESRAYRYHSGTWEWVSTAYSGANGAYDHAGLVPGDYRVDFCYDSDVYLHEYYNGVTDPGLATTVTVGVEQTRSGIDASLRKAIHIKGKVTAEASGLPLAGIECVARRFNAGSGNWEWASTAYSSGVDGTYDHAKLAAGDYRLEFYDGSGTYLSEFYNGVADPSVATIVTVVGEETKTGINASLLKTPQNAAHITGKVTAHTGGAAVPDVTVWAYRYNSNSGVWNLKNTGFSNSSGAYDVGGLPAGDYRVEFWDYNGRYLSEFYDGVTDFSRATTVTLGDSATRADIDATLLGALRRVNFNTDRTAGSNVSSPTQAVVYGGDAAAVLAMPPASHSFVNWTGTGNFVPTANPVIVTNVTADATITAHFALKTFLIVPSAGAHGIISPNALTTVNYGADQTFTFTPADGYHVEEVLVDGVSRGASTSYTFTNVTTNRTISVTFAASPATTHTLTFVTDGTVGATVSSSTQDVVSGGEAAAVLAVPPASHRFVNWTGIGTFVPTANPVVVTNVTENATLTAHFAVKSTSYLLTYAAGPGGTLSGNISQTVISGSNGTTVTAMPNAGYHFSGWSDGVLSAARREMNVTSDKSVIASFAPDGTPTLLPVYRFLNLKYGTHFYTATASEYSDVLNNKKAEFAYEGIAYQVVPKGSEGGSIPVHRFLSKKYAYVHFYTADPGEYAHVANNMTADWYYEGVGYNVWPTGTPDRAPVNRFLNLKYGVHFYTATAGEYTTALGIPIYSWEGIGFAVVPSTP